MKNSVNSNSDQVNSEQFSRVLDLESLENVSGGAQVDYFLKVTGCEGESLDSRERGKVKFRVM